MPGPNEPHYAAVHSIPGSAPLWYRQHNAERSETMEHSPHLASACDFLFRPAARTSNDADPLPHRRMHSPAVTDPFTTKQCKNELTVPTPPQARYVSPPARSAPSPAARFARPREPAFPYRLYRQKRHGPLALWKRSERSETMEHSPICRVRLPIPNGGPHPQGRRPDAPLPTALPRRHRPVRYHECNAELPDRSPSPPGSLRSPPRASFPPSNPSAEPARFCSPDEPYSVERLATIRQSTLDNQRRSHHGATPSWRRDSPTSMPTTLVQASTMLGRAFQLFRGSHHPPTTLTFTPPHPPARFARPRGPALPHRIHRQNQHDSVAPWSAFLGLTPFGVYSSSNFHVQA